MLLAVKSSWYIYTVYNVMVVDRIGLPHVLGSEMEGSSKGNSERIELPIGSEFVKFLLKWATIQRTVLRFVLSSHKDSRLEGPRPHRGD